MNRYLDVVWRGLAGAFLGLAASSPAQDWNGPFSLIPLSAPDLVLAAAPPANAAGVVVSIDKPTGADNQVWVLSRRAGAYALCAKANPSLVLAARGGGTNNGTAMVLEQDADKPWQRWTVVNHPNGAMSLLPTHAAGKGLDDLGGRQEPGAQIDLWEYHPGDEHLQWVLKPLAGATVPPEIAKGPRLDPLAPRGTVKEFTFNESKIFPGTRRTGNVFIPAQYNPAQPACVYVRQDGYDPGEKKFLESLISVGDMPVTVGVFVRPGEVPAPINGTMGRRNRDFEYDAVNDNYARFLAEELLPFVAKAFNLNLSTNGNDRCLAGGSSGGIAAFNAAWQRPDAFTRVYANSGSFVAFRGGHEFPTLIRKTEPRPIRAYLTTGTHDMINCAGDWYLLDQEMDKALEFAGYDYSFHAIEGPHVAGWMDHFPTAMRFIWKGWPEPVKAGTGAPRVRDVLVPNENWKLVADSAGDARGPACNSKGEVFFADVGTDTIFKLGLDGAISVFVKDAEKANAVTIGPKDEVITASEVTGRILSYGESGSRRVVAEHLAGRHLLARPDGLLYVSGHTWPASQLPVSNCVWQVKEGKAAIVEAGIKRPTGLAYRPDQWLLAVADGDSRWAYSYQINVDGSLTNKERFFWLHVADSDDDAGSESVCYAREGQILFATRSGIQVCADDGPTQVILPMPDGGRVFGVCLGGPEHNTLFVFCGGRIWKRVVRIHGIGAFSPWQKVQGTPL